jgi:hypothetical protein
MSSPPPAESQAPANNNRITALSFWLLIGMIATIGAGKAVLSDSLDPDLFWHLRVAEQLRADGIGPIVDHLSFSSIKDPWTPYSWLAELGMKWQWDHWGWRSAVAIKAIVVAGIIVMIALCALTLAGPERRLNAVVGTAFGAFLTIPFLSFRPVTFAILLLGICAYLLLRDRQKQQSIVRELLAPRGSVGSSADAARAEIETNPTLPRGARSFARDETHWSVWSLVPLTVLITNIHLSSIVVPIWVGCLFIGALIERRHVQHYAILLIATSLACLATPMLAGAIRTAWYYQSSDVMVNSPIIAEMRPVYYGMIGKVTVALLLVLLVLSIARRRELRWGEGFWLIAAILMTFRLSRFGPMLAFIAAPILAAVLPTMRDRVLRKAAIAVALGAVLLLGVGRIIAGFPSRETSMDKWVNRHLPAYPTEAASYVDATLTPRSHRLINEFNWGGYLEWRLGDRYQVFLDGRTQLFTPEFWRKTYLGSDEDAAAILRTADADAAIIPKARSQFRKPLEMLGWQSVYHDDVAEVLLPPRHE